MPDQSKPDLSTEGAVILGDGAAAALEKAAQRAGILCTACAEPMDGYGYEYVSLRTEMRDGNPTAVAGRVYICDRDSCAEVRAHMEETAAARRDWPAWHLFDRNAEQPPSAPSS